MNQEPYISGVLGFGFFTTEELLRAARPVAVQVVLSSTS